MVVAGVFGEICLISTSHFISFRLLFFSEVIFDDFFSVFLRLEIIHKIQGVQEKLCYSQFTATPPSPTSLVKRL